MGWITTGTVNLVNGSNVVTGVGSLFLEDARIGDGFRGPNGMLYEVTNVPTNTSLTIQPAYEGATVNAAPYFLVPIEGYVKESADLLRTATRQIALIPAGKQDKNTNLTTLSGLASIANLTAFSGLTGAADRLPYFTGAGALSLGVLTAKARLLLARTDTAGMQAELALVPVTSATDATVGRLVTTGWMGLGGVVIPINNGDFNTFGNSTRLIVANSCANGPITGSLYVIHMVATASQYIYQRATDVTTGRSWERQLLNSVWQPWVEILKAGSFGMGTVSGTLLSNANVELPSGKYYTSTDWTGSPFTGTSSLNRGYLDVSSWGQTGYQCQEFTPLFVAAGNPKMFRTNVGGVWRAWEPTLSASTAGTAAYLTVTTSYTDSTLGRAVKVGDFGIGSNAVPQVTDFNADIKPGWYCGYGDSHASAAIAAPPGSGGGAISILAMQGLNSANYKTFLAGSLGGSQDLFIGSRWSGTSTAPAWRRVITDGNATLDPALNTGGIVFSGSNANGSFTKFADGTLIQRGSGSETTTTVAASVYGTTAGNMTVLNKTIGLPVAFYSTDFHAQCVATDRGATNLASSKTTTSFFTQLQHNGAIAVPYTWIAIGRWKA